MATEIVSKGIYNYRKKEILEEKVTETGKKKKELVIDLEYSINRKKKSEAEKDRLNRKISKLEKERKYNKVEGYKRKLRIIEGNIVKYSKDINTALEQRRKFEENKQAQQQTKTQKSRGQALKEKFKNIKKDVEKFFNDNNIYFTTFVDDKEKQQVNQKTVKPKQKTKEEKQQGKQKLNTSNQKNNKKEDRLTEVKNYISNTASIHDNKNFKNYLKIAIELLEKGDYTNFDRAIKEAEKCVNDISTGTGTEELEKEKRNRVKMIENLKNVKGEKQKEIQQEKQKEEIVQQVKEVNQQEKPKEVLAVQNVAKNSKIVEEETKILGMKEEDFNSLSYKKREEIVKDKLKKFDPKNPEDLEYLVDICNTMIPEIVTRNQELANEIVNKVIETGNQEVIGSLRFSIESESQRIEITSKTNDKGYIDEKNFLNEINDKLPKQQKKQEEKEKPEINSSTYNIQEQQLEQITEELYDTKCKLENKEKELEKIKVELVEEQKKSQNKDKDLKNMETKLETTEKELKDTKIRLETTEKKLEETKKNLESTKIDLEVTQKKLEEEKIKLENTKKILEGKQKDGKIVEQDKNQLKDVNKELDEKKQKIKETTQKLDGTRENLKQTNTNIQEIQGQKEKTNKLLNSLKDVKGEEVAKDDNIRSVGAHVSGPVKEKNLERSAR